MSNVSFSSRFSATGYCPTHKLYHQLMQLELIYTWSIYSEAKRIHSDGARLRVYINCLSAIMMRSFVIE